MSKPKVIKTVYFVRHGQSEGNISPVFQHTESPLSEEGQKQAGLIARRAKNIPFQKLIASPQVRAKDTARAIEAATSAKPEFSDLFVERVKPTSVNGKPHQDKNAGRVYSQWEKSLYTPGMRVEDGENYDDIIKRADKALKFLEKIEGKEILVVTHGYFLRTIIFKVMLGTFFQPKIFEYLIKNIFMENTGLSVIKFEKLDNGYVWRLWIHNDHAHLG